MIFLFLLSCRLLERIVIAKLQTFLLRFYFVLWRRRNLQSELRKRCRVLQYRAPILDMNTQHLPELWKIDQDRSVAPLRIEILKHPRACGFIPDG